MPGPPLALRLVVSRVCDVTGATLAVWYLLTNVPAEVDTATVALWYYWRWRVESLFKLLKGAGQQVERWRQEGGEALAKRLLVAAMACAVAWRLERQESAEAADLRRLLVRLSAGRWGGVGRTRRRRCWRGCGRWWPCWRCWASIASRNSAVSRISSSVPPRRSPVRPPTCDKSFRRETVPQQPA